MIGVDTKVLLRYLTQDDAVQSAVATRFIEFQLSSTTPGHVSLVTLAELAWVLGSRFRATTAEIVDMVSQLASDARFVLQDDHAVWLALESVDALGVDLPDALIGFVNLEHGCSHTVTFDQRAAHLPGMTLLR